jgi:hypothetical protein
MQGKVKSLLTSSDAQGPRQVTPACGPFRMGCRYKKKRRPGLQGAGALWAIVTQSERKVEQFKDTGKRTRALSVSGWIPKVHLTVEVSSSPS